jgi:hypothetical protein
VRYFTIPTLFAAAIAMAAVTTPAVGQTSSKSSSATKRAVKKSAKKPATTRNAVAKPTVTPPWRLAYHDANVVVSIDTSKTRTTPDGFFQAHLRWAYKKDQGIERDRSYRTLVEDRLLDCDYVQTKPINATVYDANDKVVNSFTTPLSDVQYMSWSRRKAGSTNEKALTAVCHLLRPGSKATKSSSKSRKS